MIGKIKTFIFIWVTFTFNMFNPYYIFFYLTQVWVSGTFYNTSGELDWVRVLSVEGFGGMLLLVHFPTLNCKGAESPKHSGRQLKRPENRLILSLTFLYD